MSDLLECNFVASDLQPVQIVHLHNKVDYVKYILRARKYTPESVYLQN